MRIDKIKINGFGKIENKEIEFKDGINIVYGENESGKSTILKFLSAMLYGTSKSKNGKNISDFDKYRPWKENEFSGKIKYVLDDETEYEIFRDFKKKNPIIYNEFGSDISKEFKLDKTKGISFFEEQTGVDETTFLKTVAIEQNDVKLNKLDTNLLIQKMSNLVSTGDDNTSFKKSMEKLNKMQLENVGSDRTKQKPINIVNEKIDELMSEKKKVNYEIQNSSDNQKKIYLLNQKIQEEQAKKELIDEMRELDKLNELNNSKLDFENDLLNEYFLKVNELRIKINEKSNESSKKKKRFNRPLFGFIFSSLVVISIIIYFVFKNIIASLISVIPPLVVMCYMIKRSLEEKNELDKTDLIIKNEYEVASKNYEKKKKEIEYKEKLFEQELKKKQKEILEKYKKKINHKFLEKIINEEINLENELELIQNIINENNVELRLIENEKLNNDDKIEKLTKIEEQLIEQKNVKSELESLNEAYNIAKECMEIAYREIKQNMSPRFQEKLCEIIENITNGKYKNIVLNDETEINIELPNGEYMPIYFLSVGTIDEIFLSFRLSTLKEVSTENLPLFFDETFAYFDKKRLKNILLYLQDQFYDRQIIIFTCTDREIFALNELKIEYNLISLES